MDVLLVLGLYRSDPVGDAAWLDAYGTCVH